MRAPKPPHPVAAADLSVGWRVVKWGARAGWRAFLAAAQAAWTERARPGTALLIDLDSLGVRNPAVEATLRAVLDEAGPCRVRLAAGHPQSTRHAQRICRELGIDVLQATSGRNAADRVLLAAAVSLRGDGVTCFVVCSHDGDLAAVPGRYRVIATGRGPVGHKLRKRAESVTTIDIAGTVTTTAATRHGDRSATPSQPAPAPNQLVRG